MAKDRKTLSKLTIQDNLDRIKNLYMAIAMTELTEHPEKYIAPSSEFELTHEKLDVAVTNYIADNIEPIEVRDHTERLARTFFDKANPILCPDCLVPMKKGIGHNCQHVICPSAEGRRTSGMQRVRRPKFHIDPLEMFESFDHRAEKVVWHVIGIITIIVLTWAISLLFRGPIY